jgi:hypothetical protein
MGWIGELSGMISLSVNWVRISRYNIRSDCHCYQLKKQVNQRPRLESLILLLLNLGSHSSDYE